MSNMFSSRKLPLAVAAGVFGGIFYMTYGANQEPRPRTTHHASNQAPVSEVLQSVAGTGGPGAQHDGDSPRDTRVYSADPSALSKRHPAKVKDDV